VYYATDSIEVRATPEQTWQILSDLRRLPQWYVPAQSIKVVTDGPVREGWQFILAVKTLPGLILKAVGTVNEFDPSKRIITWHGRAMGISGNSRWQVLPTAGGFTQIKHTFEGRGWLMFLSQKSGRNHFTVQRRLVNLRNLAQYHAEQEQA